MRNPAQCCSQMRFWSSVRMGRKSFILSGEALGALLPLNVCWRFMNLHMHFGRGTEETETVIGAFAPGWLGHLGSPSAAKQHLPCPHANHRQRSRQQLQRWFWKWYPNARLDQVSSQGETQNTCSKDSYCYWMLFQLFLSKNNS